MKKTTTVMLAAVAAMGWTFYVRHADGIRFENVKCSLVALDARPRFVFDDADVKVEDEVAK